MLFRGVARVIAKKSLHRLLHNRDYILLFAGQTVSSLGTNVSGIAFPLLILSLTGSPASTGLLSALGFVPYLVLSLPAGALADRWDRKRVMILCDAGRALNMATIPVADALGHLSLIHIAVVLLVDGILFVFFNVSELSALPQVVPAEDLPQALAQNNAVYAVAGLAGPPLGGFLFGAVSRIAPFLADALSYGASMLSLTLIRTRFQEERSEPRGPVREEILEGVRWLWGQPALRFLAFLAAGRTLVDAGSFLLVILLARQQGASPAEIGALFSAGGIGALLSALLGGPILRRFSLPAVLMGIGWVEALLYPLLAVAPNPFSLGAVLAAALFVISLYSAAEGSYRLTLIPDRLQGRANSVFRMIHLAGQPVGAALSGVLLQTIGPRASVAVFFLVLVLLAVAATANPDLRRITTSLQGA